MLKISFKFLTVTCCMFFVCKSYGQDTTARPIAKIWDLAACLQYAKEHNITLRSLKLDLETARQNQLLAKAAVLPDLYGSASQSVNHYNQATGTNGNNLNYSGSYGVSSAWTLFQGGYLKTNIKQQELLVQSSSLSIMETANSVDLQIAQAYLNILVDKESIIYNKDLVTTSTAQLEQIKRQFAAGSVAKKDVAQFEAQLATDKFNLNAAENAERNDKIALRTILQLPALREFDVVKPDTLSNATSTISLNTLQDYALANRPEVKNAELGTQIADLALSKAKSGYLPTLSLGAGVGTSYARDPSYNAFRQFDNNFYQQAGLTLSIPIFTKRQNKTNVSLAKIQVEQSKLTLENTKSTLALTTESAYNNMQNATSQYAAAAEQVKYNQELYRIANQELKVGVLNAVDFYQQRNLYVQATQSFIQAKYNAALAAKIYEFYYGVPFKL
ncbi:TolC family protein [Pedobacter duraquae]|uniref:Outer membrane protein n=1 Tax=Pedobacter duraquae TaxID=425511 RepID=A0A4V3C354_9SPHI|nr:TolC family protein [Pedobacter duraquae]TDO20779.1 outer membrane protein [Pedobacter duraquae]